MTREQMDALVALHDRWSTYDALVSLLALTSGLLLVALSFLALEAQREGLAGVVVTVGASLVAWALHREPYRA